MATVVKCPACEGPVSSDAPTCPKCGHPLRAARPQRSALQSLVYLAIIVGAGYVAWTYWVPRSVREGAERLVTAGHQVILDERFGVSSKSAQARSFSLKQGAEIEVSVNVDGDGVDTYLVEEHEWAKFKAAKESMFGGGQFRHFPVFHTPKTQRTVMRGRIDPGTYYVIVENPTWGILSRSNFTVHLRIVANP